MKIDLNKKQTLGTKRTLKQLRDTLGTLLCEKSFDEIQVTEICERSMIPKSTFYNYFDDKYDLLHYFMKTYELEISADVSNATSLEVLNNLLDEIEKYWKRIEKIFRYNPPTGYFYQEYQNFFIESCYRAMSKSDAVYTKDVPFELITKTRAYVVLTVIEWVYFQGHPLTREEMIRYISQLAPNIL